MRSLAMIALSALLVAGCGGGISDLSDAELRRQAADCQDLGGSRKIKAMTCGEVESECERRRKAGKRVC